MNGDSEQKEEHRRGNKFQSIGELTETIKDGDEKYISRLGILTDLLSDSNRTCESLVELAVEIRNRLPESPE